MYKVFESVDSMMFMDIPDHLKTQRLCNKATEENLEMLEAIPDRYKTHEMCERAVKKWSYVMVYVSI